MRSLALLAGLLALAPILPAQELPGPPPSEEERRQGIDAHRERLAQILETAGHGSPEPQAPAAPAGVSAELPADNPLVRLEQLRLRQEQLSEVLAALRVEQLSRGQVDPEFPSPEIDLTDPVQRQRATDWYISRDRRRGNIGASGAVLDSMLGPEPAPEIAPVTTDISSADQQMLRSAALQEDLRLRQERLQRRIAERLVDRMASGELLTADFPTPEIDLANPTNREAATEWYMQHVAGAAAAAVGASREETLMRHRIRLDQMRTLGLIATPEGASPDL